MTDIPIETQVELFSVGFFFVMGIYTVKFIIRRVRKLASDSDFS